MLNKTGLRSAADFLFPKNPKNSNPSQLPWILAAVVAAVLPLDISQLSFAVLGALLYMFLSKHDDKNAKKRAPLVSQSLANAQQTSQLAAKAKSGAPQTRCQGGKPTGKTPLPRCPPAKLPSVAPILAPNFSSRSWDGEVSELVSTQLLPTPESEATVKRITQVIAKTLRSVIPGIEVSACASGNLFGGRAFGVAVPEVEIIASISPKVLFEKLHGNKAQTTTFDEHKLQKSAIRLCTDHLVNNGLKFRRSKFRGSEPKVTLLVPASLGIASDSVAMDFSVNVVTPLYNAALLTECGQMDSRARELILLVKRWAKDRGICHAAKGYFSPYVWGLMSIYFLQVGNEEGPLLPSLEQFAMSSGLLHGKRAAEKVQQTWKSSCADSQKSTACLFKEFLHFYHSCFDWHGEAVSIRAGCRAAPAADLPVHFLDGSKRGPAIEDPFTPAQNLGDCLSAETFGRLLEEFARADTLCANETSLSQLLEPWAPPESEVAAVSEESRSEESRSRSPTPPPVAELPPWRRAATESAAARKRW